MFLKLLIVTLEAYILTLIKIIINNAFRLTQQGLFTLK